MLAKPVQSDDLILGYTLKERIGSGGYGEVWKAEAPGGISKAIKFIYGFHDENRAQNELKAIDRIKEVRHPFLLSLERIEVANGQLVVVTELADCCLSDLFNDYEAKGESGIPREELLNYLRDAADALDFIFESHNLQHLDIKPENLLLVGGHIKVADFGLVKELHEVSQSLMGGLTPHYAPPELFDGRPSKTSDQYSLAIVYMEMLTGTRPFPGNTPAQLAAQHMNGRPSLRAVPRGDQPVIARALSKDPELRYRNCREMIDDLMNRKTRKTKQRKTTARRAISTSDNTVQLDQAMQSREVTEILSSMQLPQMKTEVEKLPVAECDEIASVQPTLVIGIGNTATKTLKKFRRLMRQTYGEPNETPAIGILCLDTDRRALYEATQGDSDEKLSNNEVLPVPLKKPEDYRAAGNLHRSWLSRRWIYNVPRSLQTEGLRPLGRLAYADHSTQIQNRLHSVIRELTQPEHIATTAERVGLEPNTEGFRVIILTSTAGGVGSGMTLDLAYCVRFVLDELGVNDDQITGLLLHSTPRDIEQQLLAVANTFAFLTELRHFCDYGYPGDEERGLPEFDDPAFASTYIMHLGDDLTDGQHDKACSDIATYLTLNIASECSTFFDACRRDDDPQEFHVRTTGMQIIGARDGRFFDLINSELCEALIKQWSVADESSTDVDISGGSLDLLESKKLTLELLHQEIKPNLQELAGSRLKDEILAKGEQTCLELYRSGQIDVREVTDHFDKVFMEKELGEKTALQREFETTLVEIAGSAGESFAEEIVALIDQPEWRISGTNQIFDEVITQMRGIELQTEKRCSKRLKAKTRLLQQLEELLRNRKAKESGISSGFESIGKQYFQLCLDEMIDQGGLFVSSRVIARLKDRQTCVLEFVRELRFNMSNCLNIEAVKAPKTEQNLIVSSFQSAIREQLPQMIGKVNLNLQNGWLHENGGLLAVMNDKARRFRQLSSAVIRASQIVLTNIMKELDVDAAILAAGVPTDALVGHLDKVIRDAKPQLYDCGGQSRVLVALPAKIEGSSLANSLEHRYRETPTIIPATSGEVVFCYELQQVPLNNIAFRLMERRPDCAEYVSRLHTRTDVDWSTLNEIFAS